MPRLHATELELVNTGNTCNKKEDFLLFLGK